MSLVDLSISTAIVSACNALAPGLKAGPTCWEALFPEGDHLLGPLAHRIGGGEIEAALAEHLLAFLDVGAFHPDHDRHRHAKVLDGRDHPFGEDVAPQNAAENIDEDRLHARVGHQDPEGVLDLLGV